MKRKTGKCIRLAALVLCAGMLTACSAESLRNLLGGSGTPTDEAELRASEGLGSETEMVRADVDYADMAYEHYDIAAFTACADAVTAFAENGGDQEAFDEADDAMLQELQYVAALSSLADVAYMQDTTDSEAAAENLYIQDVVYQAHDAYWDALHAVAASDNAILMRSHYSAQQVMMFKKYDDSSYDELTGLYAQESALEQQYYELIDTDNPDFDAIRSLYAELVSLRKQIAKIEGYDSAAEYYYSEYFARDWTPEDAQKLWETAKQDFVPLYDAHAGAVYRASDAFAKSGTLDSSPESILAALGTAAPQISPVLQESLDYLETYHLYDISMSDTKVNTGFTTYLYYYNEPFVFNDPSGDCYDYSDIFHEFGHFTSMYLHGSDLVFGVQDNDLSELQSQGMEVCFFPYYEEIFGKKYGAAMRDDVTLSLMNSVIEGALFDEFQQRVFAEDNLTGDRVQEIFDEVCVEYDYDAYSGIETYWMYVSHNFDSPFYYISYAASALPALEIYAIQQDNQEKAEKLYMKVENMSPEDYYFTDAVKEAGLSDVFDSKTGRNIARSIEAAFTY